MRTRNILIVLFCLAVLISACQTITKDELTSAQMTAIAGTVTAYYNEMTQTPAAPTKTATKVEETQTPTPAATETPTGAAQIGPASYPEGVNPLTGLKVENPDLLKRRPVIIKVSNHQIDSQPHWGLSSADMVFEYFIGWGANRFAALFYGQDVDRVGPVRSIRRVDGQLGSLYEAVVGSTGGNQEQVLPYLENYIPGRYFTDKYLCPGVCDDGRNVVYSVFGNSAALSEYFRQNNVYMDDPQLYGMAFTEDAPAGGQKADSAWVHWSYADYSQWVYDSESGKYIQWVMGESTGNVFQPLIDQNTGQALAFSNVVFLETNYTEHDPTLHTIDLIGNTDGRKAIVFRDGQAYELWWKTPANNKPIQFFDAKGKVFPFKPGNTWIVIVGQSSLLEIEDGDWSISFSIP